MYGPVSATLRRLGVRQAPFMASVGAAWTSASRLTSSLSSLQTPVRRNLFVGSRCRPSYLPQGRHLSPLTQSQAALPAMQSASVGTSGPTCATPMSWNAPSESSGVLWQSTQAALPTKSCAPRRAASSTYETRGPAATHLSSGVCLLAPSERTYSNASSAFAQLTRTWVTAV